MTGAEENTGTFGELVLSGGGSVAVATDALFAAVAELRRFAGHSDGTADRLVVLSFSDGVMCVGPDDGGDLAAAAISLRRAAARADALAIALQAGAENYGEQERRTLRLWRSLEGWAAEQVGERLSLVLPFLPLLAAASTGVAGLLLAALLGTLQRAGSGGALEPPSRALTDPDTVALVRSLVVAGDDFAAGLLPLPPGTAALLGEQGIDLVGLSGLATLLAVVAAPFGALREGDVRIRRSARWTAPAAPDGFRDRVDRVPAGPSQIRIERYSFGSGPDRFQVFLGGTRAAGVLGGDEPWDMTSNVHGVAELSPGSLRAAEEAMRQAGVTAESEVVFTGYSQGGLLATELAASGDWTTRGLVTFGAPVGGMAVPEGFPAVHVEHSDDLVPALGGDRHELGPIVARREAFAGRQTPEDVAVPAHGLAEYRSTAELLDAARAPGLVTAARRLRSFGEGAERIEVGLYRAERVPEG